MPFSRQGGVKRGQSSSSSFPLPTGLKLTGTARARTHTSSAKCKFSHNLEADRKTQKASLYADKRDEGKEGGEKKEDGASPLLTLSAVPATESAICSAWD